MDIKHSLVCLTLLTAASTSFAAHNHPYFYTSVGAGIYKAEFDNVYTDQSDLTAQNIAQPANQHGYTGQVAIGYSRPWCERYFFGGELSANGQGHNATTQSGSSTSVFSDIVQVQYNIDLTFVPGIKLSETISSYLKLGVSYAVVQDNLNSPAGTLSTPTNYSSRQSMIGAALGLGVAKSLTDRVSLFTEAMYHDYGTVDFDNFQNFTATYAHSAHVYSYDVIVGAAYSFT